MRSTECCLLSLPRHGADIARLYADELTLPSLKEPLENFLCELRRVPVLAGIGLTIWREPQAFTFLSVYALTNSNQRPRSNPRQPHPCPSVEDAYKPLRAAVRNVDATLLFSQLYFVNMQDKPLTCVARRLTKELTNDSLNSLITLARVR